MNWHMAILSVPLLLLLGCVSSRETVAEGPPETPCSVTIEAVFVEVSEENIHELGFEWLIADDCLTHGDDKKTEAGANQTNALDPPSSGQ